MGNRVQTNAFLLATTPASLDARPFACFVYAGAQQKTCYPSNLIVCLPFETNAIRVNNSQSGLVL